MKFINPKCTADVLVDDIQEPTSVEQAIGHTGWYRAIEAELLALKKNNTWTLVLRPKYRKIIDSKWVFKIKRLLTCLLEKLKARLVTKGYDQSPGFDFGKTFSL